MVSIPKIIQLKNRDEEKVYPVIYGDYCIEDTSIREKKLADDVKEKLNPIVIEMQDSGEYSSGRKVYKPKDTDFINKVAYYYDLYNSGKPINFLFSKVDIEISSTNNYQVPVKEISKPFTAKMPYTLYGRNGNYKIECVVNTSSNFVQAYIDEDSITSNDISNNSITGDKITSGAVTTDKIANKAITTDKLTDGSVTTDKLSDGAITSDKLANSSNYLMKDSVVTIPLNGQLDVIIDFVDSPATILSAALENLNKGLPIIFKIQTVAQTNSPIYTNYSSSYYYRSSTNSSTKITTHYLGTYFRAPNNQNALYKVEITWTADTISEPTVTMTNVS